MDRERLNNRDNLITNLDCILKTEFKKYWILGFIKIDTFQMAINLATTVERLHWKEIYFLRCKIKELGGPYNYE